MALPRADRPWPHLQDIKHACACKLEWCKRGRYQHYYGSTRVAVPSDDRKLVDIWLGYLGYSAAEKEQAWKKMTRRVKPEPVYVSAVHFHDCDVDFTGTNGKRMRAVLHAETRHVDAMNRHRGQRTQPKFADGK
jgi:hypothetical protein